LVTCGKKKGGTGGVSTREKKKKALEEDKGIASLLEEKKTGPRLQITRGPVNRHGESK